MKTAKEIGEMFGKSDRQIQRLAESGKLPALRVGSSWRFDPAEVRRVLEEDSIKFRKLWAEKNQRKE